MGEYTPYCTVGVSGFDIRVVIRVKRWRNLGKYRRLPLNNILDQFHLLVETTTFRRRYIQSDQMLHLPRRLDRGRNRMVHRIDQHGTHTYLLPIHPDPHLVHGMLYDQDLVVLGFLGFPKIKISSLILTTEIL